MSDQQTIEQARDALWTYIGQNTWLLQIAPRRYLIRSTYRNVLDSGAGVSLICIDTVNDIHEFLHLADDIVKD